MAGAARAGGVWREIIRRVGRDPTVRRDATVSLVLGILYLLVGYLARAARARADAQGLTRG